MNLARKRLITMYVTILFLFSIINTVNFIEADPPRPSFYFQEDRESENGTKWIGTFQGSVRLNKVRISLYDNHLKLRETGLMPEYSENSSKGYFIEYYDINENAKFDATDLIIIHEKGEVQPSWGVVLTYEPSEEKIVSVTLSGGIFQFEVKNETEDFPFMLLLFIVVYILACIIIIVFDRKVGK